MASLLLFTWFSCCFTRLAFLWKKKKQGFESAVHEKRPTLAKATPAGKRSYMMVLQNAENLNFAWFQTCKKPAATAKFWLQFPPPLSYHRQIFPMSNWSTSPVLYLNQWTTVHTPAKVSFWDFSRFFNDHTVASSYTVALSFAPAFIILHCQQQV